MKLELHSNEDSLTLEITGHHPDRIRSLRDAVEQTLWHALKRGLFQPPEDDTLIGFGPMELKE